MAGRLRSSMQRLRQSKALRSSHAENESRPRPYVDKAGRLRELPELIGTPGERRVIILAHPVLHAAVPRWLSEFREDKVFVMAGDEPPEWELARHGATFIRAGTGTGMARNLRRLSPVDVVVNLLPVELLPDDVDDQTGLFKRAFRALAPGGAYVFDRQFVPTAARDLGVERWTELLAMAHDHENRPDLKPAEVELARSVGTVILSSDLLAVTKRLKHHVKLRETEVETELPRREPQVEVALLEARPGGAFTSRAEVHTYGPVPDGGHWSQEIVYPEVALRRYRGELVSSGGMLLHSGNTVLPDSFRWHLSETFPNPKLLPISAEMARLKPGLEPRRRIEGPHYFLDSAYSGHFGHMTTEVISRLWGWAHAKAEEPGLRAFFHLRRDSDRDPRLERTLLTAYGIDEADIVWVNEPVVLDCVLSASPMWHNAEPFFAHPGITEVWAKLTDRLLLGAAAPTHERIFVSRGPGTQDRRRCTNQAQVERLFADHGFHVFYPEELSLAEQVSLFANARVVAGFGGSAMFNLMHARDLERTIVLSHTSYTARNEHLFASLIGGELHYFWSQAEVEQPETGRTWESFFSAWTFDVAEHGEALRRLLS